MIHKYFPTTAHLRPAVMMKKWRCLPISITTNFRLPQRHTQRASKSDTLDKASFFPSHLLLCCEIYSHIFAAELFAHCAYQCLTVSPAIMLMWVWIYVSMKLWRWKSTLFFGTNHYCSWNRARLLSDLMDFHSLWCTFMRASFSLERKTTNRTRGALVHFTLHKFL